MYIRLSENKTKQYYRHLLADTIAIVDEHILIHQDVLWLHIKEQLTDIKLNVVDNDNAGDWEDVYNKYDIGTIAIQLFQDDEEMQERLFDAFSGAVHYHEMDE